MKLHLILIFLFFSFIVKKNDPVKVVSYQENKLENVSNQLTKYIQSIKVNLDSEIDIFHIGDSHIQIGEFSKGFLTKLIQKNFLVQKGWYLPNLIFPDLSFQHDYLKHVSSPFLCEKIIQEKKTLNLGITGRGFRFDNEKTVLKFNFDEKIHNIELFHSRSKNAIFESDRRGVVRSTDISENYSITKLDFEKAKSNFKIYITNNKIEKNSLVFYGMRHNFKEKQPSYSTFGVSGAKFKDFEFASGFYKQLQALKPEILLITLGTNDSYYKELNQQQFCINLSFFIQEIKRVSPTTELIFMNVPDTYFKNAKPKNGTFINEELEKIAKKENCAFWNWYKIMGGENSIHQYKQKKLVEDDLLHFSSKGYRLFGELFCDAFIDVN